MPKYRLISSLAQLDGSSNSNNGNTNPHYPRDTLSPSKPAYPLPFFISFLTSKRARRIRSIVHFGTPPPCFSVLLHHPPQTTHTNVSLPRSFPPHSSRTSWYPHAQSPTAYLRVVPFVRRNVFRIRYILRDEESNAACNGAPSQSRAVFASMLWLLDMRIEVYRMRGSDQ